ncbi:MAG: murein biosynthesis integral membrane protein MurJ [Candidatus Zixiibacteriota bacterium]|nr:MAG: murein biosynthesis integral membrane protein MurJ [candidate division Zixibacteria bacterium]
MSISNENKSSLVGSVSVVSGATAFSRVLGLVREQVMAFFFGAGLATDAFLTAFRIPNLLRDMFAEGALSAAFVPVFKEKMVKESDAEAFRLADIVITAILLVVGFIVLLGIIASPVIVYISAHGFTAIPEKFDLTVDLTRVMFVYLLLVSLSALVMGMLNSFGKFGIPALSPALFNLGIIVTVVVLHRYLDTPVYSLAFGVLLGGVAQLLIQLPPLLKIGFRFKLSCNFLDEGLKRVVRLLTPMIIGLSAGRINILVNTLLASFLMQGSISFLSYAYRLMHFPLGVFAVALGTVALPAVSAMVARNDMNGLKRTFDEAISLNLFVVVPSAFFLAMMGREVVDLIYTWGAFSAADSANTSLALLHYSYGLVGFAAVRVIVPFFYAFNDSKLPMKASVASVVVNMALYYPFIQILNFAGLAAATSIAGLLNVAILLYYLPSRGVTFSLGRLGLGLFRVSAAALLAFYVGRLVPIRFYAGDSLLSARIENLLLPSIVAGLIYILLCVLMGVGEVDLLIRKLIGKTAGRR